MKLSDRQSLLKIYNKVLSGTSFLRENENSLKEEDLDNTEESIMLDIKDFLENAFTVETYKEAGVMSKNTGLVVTTASGKQFQITIIQSK